MSIPRFACHGHVICSVYVILLRFWFRLLKHLVIYRVRSWKILEFETIRESHGFLSFFQEVMESHEISRKKSWKCHGMLHKPLVLCMIYGHGSLLVCIYNFTTFFHAPSCKYYNVCLVRAVRGGHLWFSKKF